MDDSHFSVEIRDTFGSRKGGFDFTIWQDGRGWCARDLTVDELRTMEAALKHFFESGGGRVRQAEVVRN